MLFQSLCDLGCLCLSPSPLASNSKWGLHIVLFLASIISATLYPAVLVTSSVSLKVT